MTPRQFFAFAQEYFNYKKAQSGEEDDSDTPMAIPGNTSKGVFIDQLW